MGPQPGPGAASPPARGIPLPPRPQPLLPAEAQSARQPPRPAASAGTDPACPALPQVSDPAPAPRGGCEPGTRRGPSQLWATRHPGPGFPPSQLPLPARAWAPGLSTCLPGLTLLPSLPPFPISSSCPPLLARPSQLAFFSLVPARFSKRKEKNDQCWAYPFPKTRE